MRTRQRVANAQTVFWFLASNPQLTILFSPRRITPAASILGQRVSSSQAVHATVKFDCIELPKYETLPRFGIDETRRHLMISISAVARTSLCLSLKAAPAGFGANHAEIRRVAEPFTGFDRHIAS